MNNELKRMRKKTAMIRFYILPSSSSGGTEKVRNFSFSILDSLAESEAGNLQTTRYMATA
jgi:hypothetical protein